jgi:hypothetical protein
VPRALKVGRDPRAHVSETDKADFHEVPLVKFGGVRA